MEFYYLHPKDEPEPNTEVDFKYLCHREGGIHAPIRLPIEKGYFCAHKALGKSPQWNPDDTEIEIWGHEKSIKANFKKVFENKEFVIWKNTKF